MTEDEKYAELRARARKLLERHTRADNIRFDIGKVVKRSGVFIGSLQRNPQGIGGGQRCGVQLRHRRRGLRPRFDLALHRAARFEISETRVGRIDQRVHALHAIEQRLGESIRSVINF